MVMGRQRGRQGELLVTYDELPRSPGHAFYDRLQEVLRAAGLDAFAEELCRPYYAAALGAPSLPPGRYFRMHLVGYFEGIDSERGLEWRCADSLSLRDFLGLELRQRVPDHSWLSRTRARLPIEVHEAVFTWVLARLAERGLVKGGRIGVDASTLEANAAMRTIRRRDTGETYRGMLTRMAKASGIATPTAAELKRLDRRRKGKRTSNAEWTSPTDPDAKIAKLKDGRTRLAYKPEHALDLDTPGRSSPPRSTPPTGATPRPSTVRSRRRRGAWRPRVPPRPRRPRATSWRTRATTAGRSSRGSPTARGGAGSPSRSPRPSSAGTATRTPGARSTAIGRGCARGWPRRRSGCGPRRSSAASSTPSTGAACAARGCAAGRTSGSATSCTWRATTWA